jgi:flagellar secretion chaperone FliS
VEEKGIAGYKSATITSADPVTITTMLFDGAVKALKKSQLHEQAGNHERFLAEAERAQLIIGELLATLDLEAGGEIAENLQAIYVYCIKTIIDATVDGPEKIADVILHIERITSAWKTATADLAASGVLPPGPDTSTSVA